MSKRQKYSSFFIHDILYSDYENAPADNERHLCKDNKRRIEPILKENHHGYISMTSKPLLQFCENINNKENDLEYIQTEKIQKSDKVCSYCSKKFDRPSMLERHLRVHTGEKPFQCKTCAKRFTTGSSLSIHERLHSGEKPCMCLTCGKRFTAASNLHYHLLRHKKTMPHNCNICGRGFATPSELISHIPNHTGEWPYNCTCGKNFSKLNLFRNHLMRHLGITPEKCNHCEKKYTIPSKLIEHAKFVHGIDLSCRLTDEDLSIENLSRGVQNLYK